MSPINLGTFSFAADDEHSSTRSNSPTTQKRIGWRQDPNESFSDWTIILKISGQSSGNYEGPTCIEALQEKFSVHRLFLGAGPRRSLYFERLFKCSQDLAETLQCTSTVKVDVSVARAFPIMLDYMYSHVANEPLNVSTGSAVALRWLANYFGIEPMFAECSKFLEKDLSFATAPGYLSEARRMCDDLLVEAAANECINDFNRVDAGGLTQLSLADFSRVLFGAIESSSGEDTVLSVWVAKYCDERTEDVPPDTFKTWMEQLEVVDSNFSVSLLRYCDLYGLPDKQLREKCLDAMCQKWPSSLVGSIQAESIANDGCEKKYDNLRETTKIDLLERALLRAKNDLCTSHEEQAKLLGEKEQLEHSVIRLYGKQARLEDALQLAQAKLKEEKLKAISYRIRNWLMLQRIQDQSKATPNEAAVQPGKESRKIKHK